MTSTTSKPMRLPLAGSTQWVAVGRDSWVLWCHPDVDEDVRVRVERRDTTWGIAEMHLAAPDGGDVKASHLRLLNLGLLTATISRPEHAQLVAGSTPGLRDLDPALVSASEARSWAESLPIHEAPIDLRLDIPPKGQRDDGFYLDVVLKLQLARSKSRGAARAVAEANGVPVSTVYSWVKEYKRRGEAGRQHEAHRLELEERGLRLLDMTFDEYYDRRHATGEDPLAIWDDDGEIIGPTDEVIADLEAAAGRSAPT